MRFPLKHTLMIAAAVLLYCGSAQAQFTIRPKIDSTLTIPHIVVEEPFRAADNKYFDRAAWNAERRRLRKERNTVEFNASFETSLQQFENWTGSGTNNFYILSNLFFRHQYKKDKLTVDYGIEANYGMNFIDDKFFKNKDEFKINGMAGLVARKDWYYSASVHLRSQFTAGYKSRTDSTLVSRFMAPGYFDVGIGFTYKKEGSPFKATLSPFGGNIVTVWDAEVSQLGQYGVPKGDRVKGKFGPSADLYYDKVFGKKEMFRYRSNFYIFTGYSDFLNPTVRWENTFEIKITRYISTKFYGQLYYLKEASTKLQYQYSFMIGLKYSFKNKTT